MAAYAALLSLTRVIDDIQNHHCPPISLDEQQLQSLVQSITSLQRILEINMSPVANIDQIDPLEIRIAAAACAAEDAIETYIVEVIKLGRSTPDNDYGEEAESLSSSGGDEIKSVSSGRYPSDNDSGEEAESLYSSGGEKTKFVSGEYSRSVSSEEKDYGEEKKSIEKEKDYGEEKRSIEKDDDSGKVNRGKEVNFIKLYEDLHQVTEEMDLITEENMDLINKVTEKKRAVVYDQQQEEVSASSGASSSTGHKTASMVCRDDILVEIMDRLISYRDHRVIPIVGMGGIGKTTLASNIYSHPLIRDHFDVCAWVTNPQPHNTRRILCELLSQVTKHKKEEPSEISEDQLSERSQNELGHDIYKCLFGTRFLIVIDNMWSIDAWENIQRFFPISGRGSRILVTTRLAYLSYEFNEDYSLQLKFLDSDCSLKLLLRTIFGVKSCPPELEEIGKEIAENCRGLPLSIVVVGGLLQKTEHNRESWESIRNNLASIVNLEDDQHCLRLLKLSYDHLPVYLKPCFLYMGVFEEDDRILTSRLIKLWISNALLEPMNGTSLKTIGKEYLKELVDRNVVIIDELGSTGNIKWCRMHDLLTDLSLRESQKYGFYHVIREANRQGINQRRVVIPGSTSEETAIDALQSVSHTRSVIVENWKVPPSQNYELLKSLDARYNLSDQRYVDGLVSECVNLQHLSIRIRSMSSFLSSLSLVWNLHTLIVSCMVMCNAPIEIWEMPQFRHIEFTGDILHIPYPPPRGEQDDVVVMENLEILKGVLNFKCGDEVVERIWNVKKLGIRYWDYGIDDDYFLRNVESLYKLESLDIRCVGLVASFLDELMFPHSLKSLTLTMNYREFELEEMLEKIGSLPLLQKLKLYGGWFETGKWEIGEDQFPSLKYLRLNSCDGLIHWTAQESSIFPRLEQLHLSYLRKLEEIPSEIGEIPTLQNIEVVFCSEPVVMSAKRIEEEQVELQGELSFHIWVSDSDETLRALASPNFEVTIYWI